MATGFNRQTIIGNLAKDADLRYTDSGKAVANLRVIANTGSGDYEHAEGFNIVLWGGLAEKLAQYLVKGKQIFVEGETRTRKFTGKDGGERYVTEVVVTPYGGALVLLGGGNLSAGVPACAEYVAAGRHAQADSRPAQEPEPSEFF